MIAERRIAINGVALETPATLVTSLKGVTVDGQPVAAPAPARLFRFHKPAGVLTAERDPMGRRTIYDVLPKELPRVMPVGRLDLNTEGLLLLTTDGELKRELELPRTEVKRTYRARAYGEISQTQLEDLIEGVEIDGIRYGSIDANMERRTGANVWIEMTLTEGKNREVRRVLEHLGLTVSRLIRTSYGPIPLADMPVGAVDEVRQHDLILFRRDLRLAPDRRSDAPLAVRPALPRPQAVEPDRPLRKPRPASSHPGNGRSATSSRSDAPAADRTIRNRRDERPARDERPQRGAANRRPSDESEAAPRGKKMVERKRETAEPLETRRSMLRPKYGEALAKPPRPTGPARPPRPGGPPKSPRPGGTRRPGPNRSRKG